MTLADQRIRIGVDIGGTFTDMVIVAESGVTVIKEPSVPADPEQGVINALNAAAARLGITVQALLAGCDVFVHGSTVATNTILEGKGAKVGLVTTEGFRDALEIRRGLRESPWSHREPFAPVLVPRHRRLTVSGRIEKNGNVSSPLTNIDVKRVAQSLKEHGAESVAVCLYNGHLNLEEEQRLVEALRDAGIDFPFSTSLVAPLTGEYERTSTVVMNAYVAPRTSSYLDRLARRLREMGLRPSVMLVQSNAGAIAVDEVRNSPVTLLLSGPASAVGALRYYEQSIGLNSFISMEIGGTSCDVVLMDSGKVELTDQLDIGGYRVMVPSVEVNTIGAGGGTIAQINLAGMLEVGPEGAGARPGPACFGFGGQRPTVTDAQVVLGRLKAGPYAGGSIIIDADRAWSVIDEHIATPLGVTCEDAAAGIIRLMEQKLLDAVQKLSVARGHDPMKFTLVAAGGAGPMHGASVAKELGCKQVYIPRISGAFCALGMLNVNAQHDYVRSFRCPLDSVDQHQLETVYTELEDEACRTLKREGFSAEAIVVERGISLHYEGQQSDIRVALTGTGPFDTQQVRREFERLHQQFYGHIQPHGTLLITKIRLAGIGALPSLPPERHNLQYTFPTSIETRNVWVDADNGWCETPVYAGHSLYPGQELSGPAIVNEGTTTILVGVGDTLTVDAANNYLVALCVPQETSLQSYRESHE